MISKPRKTLLLTIWGDHDFVHLKIRTSRNEDEGGNSRWKETTYSRWDERTREEESGRTTSKIEIDIIVRLEVPR